jgi:hypothetical protein
MNRKTLSSLLYALGILALLAVTVPLLVYLDTQKNNLVYPQTEESRYLASLEIHSWEDVGLDTVSYAYFGEALPEKLYEDELVDRRTEKMVQRFVRQIDKDHREIQAIFYTVPVQARDSQGVWRKLMRATTTIEAWQAKPMSFRESVMAFWVPVARAFTYTGGQGSIEGFGSSAGTCGLTFSNVVAGSGSYTTNSSGPWSIGINSSDYAGPGCDAQINVLLLPFDTSDIPNTFNITAASLTIDFITTDDDIGNTSIFQLSTTTDASSAILATTDFLQVPSARANTVATDYLLSDGDTTSHTFDLQSTTTIKRSGETASCGATTGVTCLGFRKRVHTHATSDGATEAEFVTVDINANTFLSTNFVESSFVPWQFQDF